MKDLRTTELLPAPAAAYVGCSRTLLLAEAAKGNLATKVVGGRLFFDRASLDAWRAARESATAGAA